MEILLENVRNEIVHDWLWIDLEDMGLYLNVYLGILNIGIDE